MEKLHQDIKSMVDHVSVPTDKLNETVQTALSSGKRQRKRHLLQVPHVMASIASLFILAIGGVLFASYYLGTVEKEVPMSGNEGTAHTDSIFYNVGDAGLKRMATEGKTKNLSLESEDQGLKVILEEGYLDSQRMAISYRLDLTGAMEFIKETSISLDLYVNGKYKGNHGYSGMHTNTMFNTGDIFHFETSEGFPEHPEIEIRVTSINNVEGNWVFTFDLDKEDEYIKKSNVAEKGDKKGNYFTVNQARLTPSHLQLNARTTLMLEKSYTNLSHFELSVVALDPNGTKYLEDYNRRSSNDSYQLEEPELTINEKVEIPRRTDSYFYKIVPYIVTYKGEKVSDNGYVWDEITAPFKQGSILETDSKIMVVEIKDKPGETIVYYEMNSLLPIFPKIIDSNHDTEYRAISYQQQDSLYEVTYQKVKNPDSLQFLMYDAAYEVFSDLEVEIDLK
ncbi:DUF4179 domain-containing protein [Bacillus sp. REN16]|uniref:DUF4179 domain-containing protein n=1 Tax=Bacillus sp. REN16 TaxID=2887296 RepID=UPI001E54A567|nr:DUF4179 domain-containing protein [Bacillus sp. REN16]MCC3358782.1 DUF4179 domain-containing protein [Bacillus sp. REN16]